MKKILTLIIFILLINLAEAAVIYGDVYDFSLEKANNVKIGINTEPRQQMIIKNGSYSFTLPLGQYKIIAYQLEKGSIVASVSEEIKVNTEGRYVLDLILFPSFEEEEKILAETEEISIEEVIEKPNYLNYILIGIGLIIIIFLLILFLKIKEIKPKKNLPEDLQKIIDFIKKSKGRTTQKEIRKQFPLSEAKISLMVTELEEKGILKRIKKGRGNIIVLQD